MDTRKQKNRNRKGEIKWREANYFQGNLFFVQAKQNVSFLVFIIYFIYSLQQCLKIGVWDCL